MMSSRKTLFSSYEVRQHKTTAEKLSYFVSLPSPIKRSKSISYSRLSDEFKVSKNCLKRMKKARKDGRPLRTNGAPVVITPFISDQLLDYIRYSNEQNYFPNIHEIRDFTSNLLIETYPSRFKSDYKVGLTTLRRFLKVNNMLHSKKITTYAFLATPCKKTVETLFQNIDKLRSQEKYPNCLIINMDETFVSNDNKVSKSHVYYVDTPSRLPRIPKISGHITMVTAITASGFLLDRYYICDKKTYSIQRVKDENLSDVKCAYSSSGWINNQLLIGWCKDVLIPYVNSKRDKTKRQHALLIVDCHVSRSNINFLNMLKMNNIDCICLPAHSTSVFQPLDLVVFSAYKEYLRKYLLSNDRYSIIKNSEYAITDSCKLKNIEEAWKKSKLLIHDTDNLDSEYPNDEPPTLSTWSRWISNQILVKSSGINEDVIESVNINDLLDLNI